MAVSVKEVFLCRLTLLRVKGEYFHTKTACFSMAIWLHAPLQPIPSNRSYKLLTHTIQAVVPPMHSLSLRLRKNTPRPGTLLGSVQQDLGP